MTTVLAACTSNPMDSYYACRKHGVGAESCRGWSAAANRSPLG